MMQKDNWDSISFERDFSSSGWMGASATCCITPDTQLDLASSEFQSEPWEGVESNLEANALVLWGPNNDPPLLIVTLDLLYPGTKIRSAIERAAAPLPGERIVVAASHTHRGPMTDETKPALGKVDACYMERLASQLEALVREVMSCQPKRLTITVGDAEAHHSINRRLRKKFVVARKPRVNEVVNAPNPAGPTDERVTVVMFWEQKGVPLAALWNYACHPVGGPARNAISSHFPGEVRGDLRTKWNNGRLPVLYFQGFSGNTRPSSTARVHSLKRRLRQIVSGRLFEDMTREAYRTWNQELSKVVIQAINSAQDLRPAQISTKRSVIAGTRFAYSKSEIDGVSFARIDFGHDLTIITASGEPVVEYTEILRPFLDAKRVIFVGCTDQVIGYLPTAHIQAEGGYEGGKFCRSFSLDGLTPNIEASVIDIVRGLSHVSERC